MSGVTWPQILTTIVALFSAVGAGAAMLTVRGQRRKLDADAAGALTNAATTLVGPMRERMAELEAEARSARQEATAAREEIRQLRGNVAELGATLTWWRAEILAPSATVDALREMVLRADGPPAANGRPR